MSPSRYEKGLATLGKMNKKTPHFRSSYLLCCIGMEFLAGQLSFIFSMKLAQVPISSKNFKENRPARKFIIFYAVKQLLPFSSLLQSLSSEDN